MMTPATVLEIAEKSHNEQYPSAPSSFKNDVDTEDAVDRLLTRWAKISTVKRQYAFQSYLAHLYGAPAIICVTRQPSAFAIDTSSTWNLGIETKNETFFFSKEVRVEATTEVLMEHDVVVTLAPKRRYPVKLNIIRIRKGEPVIVEPEDLV